MLLDDRLLYRARQTIPHLVWPKWTVQQEDGAVRSEAQDVPSREEPVLMTGDEARRSDQVRRVDRFRTEAEMGDRLRTRFVGIVDEVSLGVESNILRDDLDAVLVGANGSVGAQAVEHAARDLIRFNGEMRIDVQTQVRDVVADPDGETVLRLGLAHLVEGRLDHRRGKVLRPDPVAAADHTRHARALCAGGGLREGGDDVEIERLPWGARLLAPLEYGHGTDRRRDRGEEIRRGERPIQAHLKNADFFASGAQCPRGRSSGLRSRAHEDDDALGVGGALVFEQPIGPARQPSKAVHGCLNDRGNALVERIGRLARLKVGVGIVRSPPDERMLGIECPCPMFANQIVADHRSNLFVREKVERVEFMRSAKPIEEVKKRDARLERRRLRYQRRVVRLLHGTRRDHREARASYRHHIGMVSEDRQRRGCESASRNMEDGRSQLASNLEHVRDHQQEALRRCKRRGQCAGLQCSVEHAGRAAFALHLLNDWDAAPYVGGAL